MARTINSFSEVKPGDRVYMFTTEFPGTVEETDSYYSTVKVRDDNGNVHFLATTRVLKQSVYEIGETYIDADNDIFTFVADTDTDAWKNNNDSLRDFSYPSRPLRKVTYGPKLSD